MYDKSAASPFTVYEYVFIPVTIRAKQTCYQWISTLI